jgi:hypothetical protein
LETEHVAEFVPVPLVGLVIWEGAQVGLGPDGAVTDHTTVLTGFGSEATAGFAPMVAVKVNVEPGWAGEGDEPDDTTVDDAALPTVIDPVPLPGP